MLTAFAVVALAACALSQEKTEKDAPPPNPTVEKLITQLGDEDYKLRDAASKKLLEMGSEALPDLRKALEHSDQEIRRRVTELVPAIETAAVLSPKIVTLSSEKQTVKQIVDDLTKQTGYKFEFFGGNTEQACSLKIEKKPLWQALDALCDAAGMTVIQTYSEESIRLQAQDCHVPHVCYDGPFRVVATGFQQIKNNNFGQLPRTNPQPQRNDSLTLNVMVYVEPKVPMLSVGQPVITSAYDEHKASMNPDSVEHNPGNVLISRGYYRNGGYKMFSTQTAVNLLPAADNARMVKHIKGNIPVTLLTAQKVEVLTTDILKAKGKKFQCGPISINLEDVTQPVAGQVQLKLNVINEESKANPNDYTWQNSIYQRIEVQDDQGNKFMNSGSSWGGSGPGHMQMTLNYNPPGGAVKAGAPAKFVFHNWSSMQTAVTFEFKELPLP
jgi:hypothetical protein